MILTGGRGVGVGRCVGGEERRRVGETSERGKAEVWRAEKGNGTGEKRRGGEGGKLGRASHFPSATSCSGKRDNGP